MIERICAGRQSSRRVQLFWQVRAVMFGDIAGNGRGEDRGRVIMQTTTPIKHVIVIFGENISFDHYFATYPYATNPKAKHPLPEGQHASREQPAVRRTAHREPQFARSRSAWTPASSVTCDQNHSYTPGAEAPTTTA